MDKYGQVATCPYGNTIKNQLLLNKIKKITFKILQNKNHYLK